MLAKPAKQKKPAQVEAKPPGKKSSKVGIPGLNLYDEPMLVNSKQARRMLVMREKRAKRIIQAQHEAQKLGKSFTGQIDLIVKTCGRFTKIRVKDQVRSRVAFSRKRENGLFVSKRRELELAGN